MLNFLSVVYFVWVLSFVVHYILVGTFAGRSKRVFFTYCLYYLQPLLECSVFLQGTMLNVNGTVVQRGWENVIFKHYFGFPNID